MKLWLDTEKDVLFSQVYSNKWTVLKVKPELAKVIICN